MGAGWVAARPEDPYLPRVVPLLAVLHGVASPTGQRLIAETVDLVARRPETPAAQRLRRAIRWTEARTGRGAGPFAERLRAWITDHPGSDTALQLLRRMVVNEVLDPTWTDWAAETALSRLHDTHLLTDGIDLLRALAGSTRLGVDLCDRSVALALRWFAGTEDHPSAPAMLRATLGATRCGAPALAEAARTTLAWAGDHPDHPERRDVLCSLLGLARTLVGGTTGPNETHRHRGRGPAQLGRRRRQRRNAAGPAAHRDHQHESSRRARRRRGRGGPRLDRGEPRQRHSSRPVAHPGGCATAGRGRRATGQADRAEVGRGTPGGSGHPRAAARGDVPVAPERGGDGPGRSGGRAVVHHLPRPPAHRPTGCGDGWTPSAPRGPSDDAAAQGCAAGAGVVAPGERAGRVQQVCIRGSQRPRATVRAPPVGPT